MHQLAASGYICNMHDDWLVVYNAAIQAAGPCCSITVSVGVPPINAPPTVSAGLHFRRIVNVYFMGGGGDLATGFEGGGKIKQILIHVACSTDTTILTHLSSVSLMTFYRLLPYTILNH